MAVTIQSRRDTAANWNTADPVLALGELGIETDTDKAKYGDGFTTWKQLDYFIDKYDGKTLPPGTEMDQTLRYDSINQNWKATSDLVVKANGNVGIGTDAPEGLLELKAGTEERVRFTGAVSFASGIRMQTLNGSGGAAPMELTGTEFQWTSGGVGRVNISTAGNVGIGTDTPFAGARLSVSGGDISTEELDGRSIGFNTANRFTNAAGNSVAYYGMTTHASPWKLGISDLQNIVMYTGAVERMRIDSDGKVGIGTDAPEGKLDIVDDNIANMSVEGSGGKWMGVYSGGYDPLIHCLSGANLRFGHSTDKNGGGFTERMSIASEGRVDITGSLFVNGQPKIGYSELLTTLVTLRSATMDETTVEGLRDSIANAIGGLIEKFEAEIAGIKDDAGSAVEPGTKL